jgi:hypothetical protein
MLKYKFSLNFIKKKIQSKTQIKFNSKNITDSIQF